MALFKKKSDFKRVEEPAEPMIQPPPARVLSPAEMPLEIPNRNPQPVPIAAPINTEAELTKSVADLEQELAQLKQEQVDEVAQQQQQPTIVQPQYQAPQIQQPQIQQPQIQQQPKRIQVVNEYPVYPVKTYKDDDGNDIELITVADALTRLLNN